MLSATFESGCAIVARVPNFYPLRISHDEAEALGQAWATYIDSIPSRKRKAATEVIERIFPGVVALGTTAMIFGPRVQYIHGLQTGRIRPENRPGRGPTPTARMPQSGERVGPLDEQINESGWELTPPNPPADGKVIPDRRAQLDAENDMGAQP